MKNKKNSAMLRSKSRAIALEPRLLFDGAGAVGVADAFDDTYAEPEQSQHEAGHNDDTDSNGILNGDELHVPGGASPSTLVIIDSRVDEFQSLLADLPANTVVRVVDSEESGLAAISDELSKGGNFDAVHIFSHGTPGSFTLGSDQVDSSTLANQAEQLQGWSLSLTEEADILLYGCDVAQGEAGQAFISELAHLTGADIAASTNATGAADQGGDWVLESETGSIEAQGFEFGVYGGLLGEPGPEAEVTVKDELKGKPVKVGEDDENVKVGESITVTGTGSYIVTVSADKGTLSGTGVTGDASAVKTFLDGLTYTYTGTSEVGDTANLVITITDTKEGTTTFTRVLEITPQNDAPTVTAPSKGLQVSEGGSVSFDAAEILKNGEGLTELGVKQDNIGLYDPDTKAEQIIIKITELPTHGTLTLDGVTLTAGATFSLDEIKDLKYTHDGSQVLTAGTETFKISIDDGAGGLLKDQVVSIDLLPVNQAPAISGSGSLVIIQGEGPVNLGNGGNLPVIGGERGKLVGTDPDDASLSYVITELPSVGTLYYNGDVVVGGQSVTDLTKLTYQYPKGLEPTDPTVNGKVEFIITVTDAGGGEDVIKSTVETIQITILDNNNDPYFAESATSDKPLDLDDLEPAKDESGNDINDVLVIKELGVSEAVGNIITITNEMLPLADADSSEGSRVYTITGSNESQLGYFTVDGALLANNASGYATFTQAQVDANLVKYHLHGTSSSERTDFIEFTVKDGAKTIIFDDSPEGGYARDGGIYDAAGGLQKFRININVPENTGGDGSGDLPELPALAGGIGIDKNAQLTLNESGSQTITKTHLSAKDTIAEGGTGDSVSSPDKITFRIEKAPAHGTIYLDGKPLKLHDSFTQADIDAGIVTFKHDGSENFSDHFHFSVSNGDIVTSSADNQFDFNITPQNDSPEASANDVTVAEGKAIEINITLTDPDNSGKFDAGGYDVGNTVGYRVDSVPVHGSLYLVNSTFNLDTGDVSGLTALVAGKTFIAGDLTGKKLIYVHDGTENYKDGENLISFSITPIDDARVGINPDGNGTGTVAADGTNQSSAGTQETIIITVTPRNDAPVFVGKGEPGYVGVPKLDEGATVTIIGGTYSDGMTGKTGSGTATAPAGNVAHLIYQDSDNSSVQRQYRVTEAPKYGTLTLDGKALSVGSVFTQDDLDSGKIQYKHDGSENHADSFDYVVSDGDWTTNEVSKDSTDPKSAGTGVYAQGAEAASVESSRYNILIAPLNDAPEISREPAAGVTGKHIVVDSTSVGTSLGKFTIKDPDLDEVTGDLPAGVTDQVRVTVEVPDGLELIKPAGTGITEVSAAGGKLVFEGSRADAKAYLDALKVKVPAGKDPANSGDETSWNEELIIKVTVDDRIYGADDSVTANGGIKNEKNKDGTDVPFSDDFNTDTIEIKVWASAVNDSPVITVPNEDGVNTPYVVNEDGYDQTGGRTKLEGISFEDPDAFDTDDNTLIIEVGEHGKIYFGASGVGLPEGVTFVKVEGEVTGVGTNKITLTGTKEALNAALASLYYASAENFNGNDKLKITVKDGGNIGQGGEKTDSTEVDIHIIPVNDNPIIGELKDSAGNVIEKDGYVTLTDSYEFSTTNGNAISFTDPDREPSEEALAESTGHQYADENALYTVTLGATVKVEAVDTAFGGISIKDGIIAGVEVTNIGEASSGTVVSTTNTGQLVLTGTYDDIQALLNHGIIYTPDSTGGEDSNIKFTVTVGDQGDGGEKISDSEAKDGEDDALPGILDNLEDSFSFFFQRTDKNDPPAFNLGGDTGTENVNTNGPTHTEGGSATVLNPGAEVTDDELDLFSGNGGSWDGAVLKVERGSGTDFGTSPNTNDTFGVSGTVFISGADVKVGAKVVGKVEKNADGTLEIQFNDKAKSADVNTVLKSITYKNTDPNLASITDPEVSVDIVYSMRDGNKNIVPTDAETPVAGTGQDQGTGGELTGYGKITVKINRQVVAVDDTAEVTEPTDLDDSATVTGDLTLGKEGGNNNDTDKAQDYDPDTAQDIKVVGVVAGEPISPEFVSTQIGAEITGQYGKLVVDVDGTYTYTVDPTNLTVQGLLPDETLDEVFTYQVSDDQGAASTFDTAKLTITINGSNDVVKVTVPTIPTTVPDTPNDKAVTDHIVYESGLSAGTSPAEAHITVTDSFTIEALDGLDEAAGLTLTVGTTTTTLTKAEIEALSTTNKTTINTEYGQLKLNGYTKAADGTITINYTYTLTTESADDGTGVIDSVTITAQDRGGKEGGGNDSDTQILQFKIIDDAPQAVDDAGSIRSGETLTVYSASGVLNKDKSGADGWKDGGAVVGVVKGIGSTPTTGVDSEIEGEHGTLTLSSDGSYSYKANPDVAEGSKDVFTYTVEDADGNQTTAKLEITISASGLTLTPPAVVDVEEKHLEKGTDPQPEGATVTGDLPLASGTTSLDVVGLNKDGDALADTITTEHGTVTLEKDGDGKYTGEYTFTLTKQADHTAGDVTDTFTYTAKDGFGNTVTNTVTVKIIDDKPEAKPDVIEQGSLETTTGNALTDEGTGKDNLGADGATVTGVVKGTETSADGGVGSTGVAGDYGTLVLNADGSYTYTRTAELADLPANAADVFTYTIKDADGDTSTTTITFNLGNKVPQITNGTETGGEIVVKPNGVKESGLPTVGSEPSKADRTTTGTITYTQGDGEHSVTVNGSPVVEGDTVSTANGKFKITSIKDGEITYEYELTAPTNNTAKPSDDFVVVIKDRDGDEAKVTVKVDIINDKPAATPDTGKVVQGQTVTGNVVTNDKSGADGWKAGGAVVGVEQGDTNTPSSANVGTTVTTALGTLTLNPDGSYSYVAKPDAGGDGVTDVFTYTVRDADGDETTATLTIAISDNTPPEANNDSATTDEDTPVSGNLLTNDKDPDGDPITVTEITVGGKTTTIPTDGSSVTIEVPGKGKITVNKNGGYTFTPNPGVIGQIPDIGYKITDGNGGEDTAKLTINVRPGNPPVAPPPSNPVDGGFNSPLTSPADPIRPRGLMDSAVITDPSVFYEGERWDDVRRLPIPLQPVVYVNNEVATAQQQREADDTRANSAADQTQPFVAQSTSLAMGLGQDHNLFVSHAIRDAQQTAQNLDSRVSGRLSRTDLSADDMLFTPDLRSSQPISDDADEANKAKKKQAPVVEENVEGEDDVALQMFEADEAELFAEQGAMPVAASFTEQLRGNSKHLPFAAREKNFLI